MHLSLRHQCGYYVILGDVARRLYQRREMAEARKRAAQAAADHPIDPATGRPFFQPAINHRANLGSRNLQGLPVGDYLYSKWCLSPVFPN